MRSAPELIYSSFVAVMIVLLFPQSLYGQFFHQKEKFTHADTLRGSITPGRSWWNVTYYHIQVIPDYKTKSVQGWNQISFEVVNGGKNKMMQIDLQQPMKIDSIVFKNRPLKKMKRTGNVYLIDFGNFYFKSEQSLTEKNRPVSFHNIKIYFSGKPTEAVRPPWDGGWIWSKDARGRPWITVACQGLGASVWYPCKDHQSDEPDHGAKLEIKIPDTLVAVGNGRLHSKIPQPDGTTIWTWEVKNPINNYNIVPCIGKYVHFSEEFNGETGKNLTLDYWVLDYNLNKAKKHFAKDVKPMLNAFEYWFGPYPFYEDGFKLIETPHLGMEHQSGIAYGNRYMNGYLGMDLSGTGWGMKWDYIIIHEAGHEWFGNNITTNDIADMWVHEGFTMYSEALFIEYHWGKKAADEYVIGIRKKILNDKPLIGPYGVNQKGSDDMYNKGANLIHTIRQIIDNDSLFRNILRGLNKEFYHRTVNSKDVETFISQKSGIDFSKIFDQYLRTINIPQFEYKIQGDQLHYRWANCVTGFAMPVKLENSHTRLFPTTEWKTETLPFLIFNKDIQLNKNFYVTVKKVE